ncbi:hypothetical protein ABV409_09570 [Flagellimonas sp. DF-77]|uniref:hypothetical protein n=1 Tax=Flagellimonas algarum TaxID=3230298 RepID=UPI00339334CC
MKNFRLIILALAGVGFLFFYFLPNVLSDDNRHRYETGTLREVYTETYQIRVKYGRKVNKQRLVLVTSGQSKRKYTLTGDFKQYWKEFQNPEAIGSFLNLKLNLKGSRQNPMEIKMDGKVIYGKIGWVRGNWITLALIAGVGIMLYLQLKK